MPGNGAPLIQLTGVRKVFFTDEVETHALADVHLEIREGEYVAINGPSGCGKTTLLSILGLLDTPSDGSYLLGQAGSESVAGGAGPDPQSAHRLRVSGLQSDRRSHRRRECRAATH